MGDMSKGKYQEEKGTEGGTGLLQVIYGDVTLGVRGTYRGTEFHYIFLMRYMVWNRLLSMGENGCTGPPGPHSGGRRRTMTGEAGFR